MALSLMILADGPGAELHAHLGPTAADLYARMLGDTLDVACRLPGAQVTVCHGADLPPATLEALPAPAPPLRLRSTGAAAVAEALDAGLATGEPAIVLRGDLPHLPLWRLRDAATYLRSGAELVVGPSDRGGWYLLGMRPSVASLAHAAPLPDASLDALLAAAGGHTTHLLPPWFGIRTVGDLVSLAETLRPMPPAIAQATRAMFEVGQASRAVGG
jgi:glycosyltransferase A (GT-A) superfamily protein (DUF2064 family)